MTAPGPDPRVLARTRTVQASRSTVTPSEFGAIYMGYIYLHMEWHISVGFVFENGSLLPRRAPGRPLRQGTAYDLRYNVQLTKWYI